MTKSARASRRLAEVCHREFGVPTRISNVTRLACSARGLDDNAGNRNTWRNAMANKSLTPEQMETRVARFNKLRELPEAELRQAQHPARRRREGHRAQGVSGDGAGRLPGPQRRRAGEGPARADRQHRRMRAAQRPRPAPPSQHGGELLLPHAAASRSPGATTASTRLVLEPNDMISVPRGENRMLLQHLRRGRPAAGDDRAGDRPAGRSDRLRAEPRPRRSRTNTARRRSKACRPSASSSRSRWASSACWHCIAATA